MRTELEGSVLSVSHDATDGNVDIDILLFDLGTDSRRECVLTIGSGRTPKFRAGKVMAGCDFSHTLPQSKRFTRAGLRFFVIGSLILSLGLFSFILSVNS